MNNNSKRMTSTTKKLEDENKDVCDIIEIS
jgi:hypothetical protein